jgi:tetratricopeptide (TPR) repeat protein
VKAHWPVILGLFVGTLAPAIALAQQRSSSTRPSFEKIDGELRAALEAREYDKALGLADQMQKAFPAAVGRASVYRFQSLWGKKDYPAAYKCATQTESAVQGNAEAHMVFNDIAWTIADDTAVEKRDLDLALNFAGQAVDLTGRRNESTLDTLARVYFEKGRIDKAIEVQTEAVALKPENAELKATLAKYQAAAKKPQ